MIPQAEANIVFPQWYAGIGVTLLLLQMGFMGGWPSPTLARLSAEDSPIPLDPEQASWVASIVNLGRFFGAILGSVSTSYLGSRRSILVTLFPVAAGWLITALAHSVEWLYVARFSSGVGLGMAFSTFPLYIGEVSMPEIRGALISMATTGSPVGTLVASIACSYLDLTASSCIYLALCIMLMVMFFWLPESPHHLLKVGACDAARKSIEWYRAGNGVDKEYDAVEKFVSTDSKVGFMDKLREFKTPPIRKATFQIIALYTFMQICGLNSIVFYMETILMRAKFTMISPSLAVMLVNLCGIFSGSLSILLIDRFGRRFLMILSGTGVTISMGSLFAFFLLLDLKIDTSCVQWLPAAAMFSFVISFCVGMFPVPSAMLSETFPANIKCMAACIASLTGAIMSFLSSKTFQPMVDAMGETYVFLIYTICSFLVIPYSMFMMMETKGKSLQQIQDELTKK
ncbi:facilitated trehalose transporter Tret1-like [Nasonia vitripennis]|uniref:Major facilitator superfamily (MFS) profile domain-containing protein n=1 Tax=Nasonia vitripennis TaxID=7425 RepID=A0A7M7GH49_NASVI|nr:facilitated trehalose transporter Tret1-like [Nasonia vitripennis]